MKALEFPKDIEIRRPKQECCSRLFADCHPPERSFYPSPLGYAFKEANSNAQLIRKNRLNNNYPFVERCKQTKRYVFFGGFRPHRRGRAGPKLGQILKCVNLLV